MYRAVQAGVEDLRPFENVLFAVRRAYEIVLREVVPNEAVFIAPEIIRAESRYKAEPK